MSTPTTATDAFGGTDLAAGENRIELVPAAHAQPQPDQLPRRDRTSPLPWAVGAAPATSRGRRGRVRVAEPGLPARPGLVPVGPFRRRRPLRSGPARSG